MTDDADVLSYLSEPQPLLAKDPPTRHCLLRRDCGSLCIIYDADMFSWYHRNREDAFKAGSRESRKKRCEAVDPADLSGR